MFIIFMNKYATSLNSGTNLAISKRNIFLQTLNEVFPGINIHILDEADIDISYETESE